MNTTTQTQADLATRLISIHAACKARKGGKAEWMTAASVMIYQATGQHFHGAAYCDGFLLNALRQISVK